MKHLSRFGVILLGCILIFSSLAPVLAAEDDIILDDGLGAVTDTLMSYYIWLCMRAWGIEISYQDSLAWDEQVSDQIFNWVLEYLQTLPSAFTVNQWIAPWQSDFDYWGNLRLNSNALEDIQDFVDWLCTKFGIMSNDVVIVTPTYSVNGVTLFELGTYYKLKWAPIQAQGQYDVTYQAIDLLGAQNNVNSGIQGYIQVHITDAADHNNATKEYNFVYISTYNTTAKMQYRFLKLDDTQTNIYTTANQYFSSYSNDTYFFTSYTASTGMYQTTYQGIECFQIIDGGTMFEGTLTEFNQFLEGAQIVQEGNTKFVTSDIVFPVEDPDYTPGDSITIIDDVPTYLTIEWPDHIEVSNLPAVVSTGTVQDPGIEDAYSPILALINYSTDAMSAIIGVMYELPEEVIIPVYAVMGAVIVFGVIKLMREH